MTRIAPQHSPREQSIHPCLIECEANKCIKIDIAEATVTVHVKAILRKIRVQRPDPDGEGDKRWDPGKTAKQMRAASAVDTISEMKQIGASDPLKAITPQADQIGASERAIASPCS